MYNCPHLSTETNIFHLQLIPTAQLYTNQYMRNISYVQLPSSQYRNKNLSSSTDLLSSTSHEYCPRDIRTIIYNNQNALIANIDLYLTIQVSIISDIQFHFSFFGN